MNDRSQLEVAALALEQSGDYRVLRRLRFPKVFNEIDESEAKIAAVLDFETTGLDFETDEIIELAIVRFTYSPEGRIGSVTGTLSAYNDPGRPIPELTTKITGIRDSDVAKTVLDRVQIEDFLSGVGLLIAHNAAFDRPFFDRKFPGLTDYSWACSATEIPWKDEGVSGARLEYLATMYGFFYDAHRAAADCEAVVALLDNTLPLSGRSVLAALLENARRIYARVYALGAAFDAREHLRRRGYRWNPGDDGFPRAWWRDVEVVGMDEELRHLESMVPPVEGKAFRMSARDRFKRTV